MFVQALEPRKGIVHVIVQGSVDWCFGSVDWWMPRSVVQVQCRDQSTDMPVGRLMAFSRVEQSTDMPVSRLVLSRNLHQSTGCLDQSTDRLGRVLERCF